MSTLYELTGKLKQLYDLMDDPDAADAAQDLFQEIETTFDGFEQKAENYAKIIKSLSADADALKQEEQRLAGRRQTIENNIERMKNSLCGSMMVLDIQKVKTPLFTVYTQRNPSSVMVDTKLLPAQYLIPQEPRPDKRALLNALKRGETIPGALLDDSGISLRIK